MSDYRRKFEPGGTYFFTVVTARRTKTFADEQARRILGDQFRICQNRWPFHVVAIVVLPEHLHALWTLPPEDADYSKRWAWIKKEFTKSWLKQGGKEQPVSQARTIRGDRGVWQPRFWEHTIKDEHDLDRHFDYIHYNPVKHGHATCPSEWPASSFQRWVAIGAYQENWGCLERGSLDFDDLDQSALELRD